MSHLAWQRELLLLKRTILAFLAALLLSSCQTVEMIRTWSDEVELETTYVRTYQIVKDFPVKVGNRTFEFSSLSDSEKQQLLVTHNMMVKNSSDFKGTDTYEFESKLKRDVEGYMSWDEIKTKLDNNETYYYMQTNSKGTFWVEINKVKP